MEAQIAVDALLAVIVLLAIGGLFVAAAALRGGPSRRLGGLGREAAARRLRR